MSQKLDGKFHGIIVKNKDGSVVPQDQWIVFLATDNVVPDMIEFYAKECARLGASPQQLAAIDALLGRLLNWRVDHPDLCKVPDVDPGEIVT